MGGNLLQENGGVLLQQNGAAILLSQSLWLYPPPDAPIQQPKVASFFAKVYDRTGVTFRRVIDSSLFLTVPRIVREVGNAAGDLTFDLALPYDNFGYGSTSGINPGDLVKLYAVNSRNPSGYLVYQGHVEDLIGSLDQQGNDHASVRLFPIDAMFGRTRWKNAGSYVINYAAADVDQIMSDVIDAVNSVFGATFFSKNLGNPALSFNLAITRQTHQDALIAAAKFLPATWYWRVRPNGQFDLGQYSDATPTHSLVMGRDVDSLQVTRSLLNTKNKVIESWGPTPTDSDYLDAASASAYGQRDDLQSDPGVTDQPSADTKGNNLVAAEKNPATKTVIVVNSNYPIETILPGDTAKVVNIANGSSQMLTGVLRIVHVEYDGSLATVSLADVTDNFGTELNKMLGK